MSSIINLFVTYDNTPRLREDATLLGIHPKFDRERKTWYLPASEMTADVYDKLSSYVKFPPAVRCLYDSTPTAVLSIEQPSLHIPYDYTPESRNLYKAICKSQKVYTWFENGGWYIAPKSHTKELHEALLRLPGYTYTAPGGVTEMPELGKLLAQTESTADSTRLGASVAPPQAST
jgi:hypothetical protein